MIDLTPVSYLLPVFSFVLVFVLVFAILKKTEILGDNNFINALISLIMAVIFISFSDVRGYVEQVSPWFVVLVVAMFFVLLLGGFMLAKDIGEIARPATAWVFIGLLALIFLAVGYEHFNLTSNSVFLDVKDFFLEKKVSGSILLGIVALVVGIIITRKVKD